MGIANITAGLSDAAMPAVRRAINSCTDLVQRRAATKPMVTMLTEPNHDGSYFQAYAIADLPPQFVVASYDIRSGFRVDQGVLF